MDPTGLDTGAIALGNAIIELARTAGHRHYNFREGFEKSANQLVENVTKIMGYLDLIPRLCDGLPVDELEETKKLLDNVTQRFLNIRADLEAVIPPKGRYKFRDYPKIKESLKAANLQTRRCKRELEDEVQVLGLQNQVWQMRATRHMESETRRLLAGEVAIHAGLDALHSAIDELQNSLLNLKVADKLDPYVVHVGVLGHWGQSLGVYELPHDSLVGDVIKRDLASRKMSPNEPLHLFAVYQRSNHCTTAGLSWVRCDHSVPISSIARMSTDRNGQSHPIRIEWTIQSKPFSLVSVFGKGFDQHAIAIGVPVDESFDLEETIKSHLKWPSAIEELKVTRILDSETSDPLDALEALTPDYWEPFRFRLCLKLHVAPPIPSLNLS